MINKIVEDMTPFRLNSCKCQFRLACLIEDKKLIQYKILGNKPTFIKNLENYCLKNNIKEIDDELYYIDELEKINLKNWHKVEKINNKWLIHVECDDYRDLINCYDKYIEKECYLDGLYILIVQMDCYSYSTMDGTECDSDINFYIEKKKLNKK